MAGRRTTTTKLPTYTAYRSKTSKRGRRRLIAALFVLLFLAAAFFVLREFIEFTPDGIRFTFLQPAETPQETAEIRFAEPVIREEPRISIDRGELPPDGPGYISGALLEVEGRTYDDILREARLLKSLGRTAAIVPVKAADRPLITAAELENARAACEAARLRFVAYISCFRDDVTPREDEALALTDESGRLFIDYTYKTWMNPYLEEARALVLERCRFAVDGGAAELLLDALFFPYEGNVGAIDYGREATAPRELIGDFAAEIAAAFDVRLGAVMDGDDTFGEGASELKGQDVSVFAECFERIWVYADTRAAALRQYKLAAALSHDAELGFAAILDGRYISAALLAREEEESR